MALRDIVIPSRVIPVGDGQSFTVNGITANQTLQILYDHRDDVGILFQQYTETGDIPLESIAGAFPLLIGQVIAIAAGGNPFDTALVNPEDPTSMTHWQADVAAAASLPLPIQVDALSKIAELTFTPEMPPKKFFGLLLEMMQGANLIASQT